jgi:hypothetical protein
MKYDIIIGEQANQTPLSRNLIGLVNEALKKGAILQGGPFLVGTKLGQAVVYPNKR